MLGPGITTRAAVPASFTQVLENADETYLYIKTRSCVTRPCVSYASLREC
jgi:hypothetical protein